MISITPETLKGLRRIAGWRQADVAAAVGVSPGTVCKFEKDGIGVAMAGQEGALQPLIDDARKAAQHILTCPLCGQEREK